MPKEDMKFSTRLEDTDYGRYPTVIDITMGEFAFSDFYPIHSDSYATCLGVAMGAVDGFGVCLAHLDPLVDTGSLYKGSLDRMIAVLLSSAKATRCDVVFFKDGFQAVAKYQLVSYLTELRHRDRIRYVHDFTDNECGRRYDEVVVMPSSFYSAYVCLKPSGSVWDVATGKRSTLRAQADLSGNQAAHRLGRAREITFQSARGVESVSAEGFAAANQGILSWLGM